MVSKDYLIVCWRNLWFVFSLHGIIQYNALTSLPFLKIKAKLLSFSPSSPITAIIDGSTNILSSLILKTGHILNILNEASKSIVYYSNECLSTVHTRQAGKLLKSANFQVCTPATSHLLIPI